MVALVERARQPDARLHAEQRAAPGDFCVGHVFALLVAHEVVAVGARL
jgi:hypothetical protein